MSRVDEEYHESLDERCFGASIHLATINFRKEGLSYTLRLIPKRGMLINFLGTQY